MGTRARGWPPTSGSRSTSSRSRRPATPATRHQRESGTGYFDAVVEAITGGESSTLALKGSTEEAQFTAKAELGEEVAA